MLQILSIALALVKADNISENWFNEIIKSQKQYKDNIMNSMKV